MLDKKLLMLRVRERYESRKHLGPAEGISRQIEALADVLVEEINLQLAKLRTC